MKKPAWTPQEKKVAVFTAVCALVGLAVLGARLIPGPEKNPVASAQKPVNRTPFKVYPTLSLARKVLDINRATERQLGGAPGMNPALAHAVVEYRAAHGPFRSMGEIRMLEGNISPQRLEFIEQYVQVQPTTHPTELETP